ncbi:uncharacterized protein RAG0_11649 [Rhynchosporium agropyri]|uniref:Uncharacterized protein n=1 Tax=Rhynchosporium agropyri TaxID=914238 RepID=A0A1E1L580_9HELO|nr:uncharacterized protein RAG0_11649 [Rhynchosporium agropyri]
MNGFAWLWSAKAVRRRARGFCTGDVVPAKIAGWEVELCVELDWVNGRR